MVVDVGGVAQFMGDGDLQSALARRSCYDFVGVDGDPDNCRTAPTLLGFADHPLAMNRYAARWVTSP